MSTVSNITFNKVPLSPASLRRTYWGVGLPSAYLLAVKAGLELRGLWGGLVTCTIIQGCVMLVVLLRFKWEAEAARSAQLVGQPEALYTACSSGGGGGDPEGSSPSGLDPAGPAAFEDSAAKLHFGGGQRGGAAGSTGGSSGIDVERQA